MDVFKKLRKVHRKTPLLECILIKMQASNLQCETLIEKEMPAQVFPYEFCKIFKDIFFIE